MGTRGDWLVAAVVAAAFVGVLFGATPAAEPKYDGVHYLAMATNGFPSATPLAAPFAYRFAGPLLVHLVAMLTGLPAFDAFRLVVAGAAWGGLMVVVALARTAGASACWSFAIMGFVALSAFQVRFPLYAAVMVDVLAFPCMMLAVVLLLRRHVWGAAGVALGGMMVKEFLVVPLAVILALLARNGVQAWKQQRRDPTEDADRRLRSALQGMVAVLCAGSIAFLLPRVLIPVQEAYGANYRFHLAGPDQTTYLLQLRSFLTNPFSPGQVVNFLFVAAAYFLPVAMLITPARWRSLRRSLGPWRLLLAVHLLMTSALSLVGGTNLMVFITYSAPVLVVVLAQLSRTDVAWEEILLAGIAVVVFNRMMLPMGVPGGDPLDVMRTFGGWWNVVDQTTAWRSAEMAGWLMLAWAVRRWGGRRGAVNDDK